MSTGTQEFSIENQKAEIRRYADRLGYEVVRTYCDVGRTGVTLRHRPGLKQLLGDALSGNAPFQAILVYDVSRWGRFQDDNEAAHYEFLCRRAGVSVHYCAEPFPNDGSMSTGLLKSFKRVMAKEYSRELGVKTYAGQERIVGLGFKVQGAPGFGLRRMMISRDGRNKGILHTGEYKSLKTDRVKLVLGPMREVGCVRRMYAMALRGMGCSDIAHAVNRVNIKRENGKPWNCEVVRTILTHPKYTGCSVWGQSSQKLHGPNVAIPRDKWILRPNTFPAIVDLDTFNQVQKALKRYAERLHWSDSDILVKLKALYAKKGRLSEALIDAAKGVPSYSTVQARFGSILRAYELIGYRCDRSITTACAKKAQTAVLRKKMIRCILRFFPKVRTVRQPGKIRWLLRLEDGTTLSVSVCPAKLLSKSVYWDFQPDAINRACGTVFARSNLAGTGFHSVHLIPARKWPSFCRFRGDPAWLAEGIRLNRFSELWDAVHALQGRP